MSDYKLVPVEQIRHVIYVLERFANDTPIGRNAASELRELLSTAPTQQGGVGEGVPDYINDAIDNLEHQNYEVSYAGYLERKKDTALIRAHIARAGQPTEQQLATDVSELVDKARILIAAGNQLSDEATESQERTFDGGAAEVASIYFWNEFRDALKAATKALEAYCKERGEA